MTSGLALGVTLLPGGAAMAGQTPAVATPAIATPAPPASRELAGASAAVRLAAARRTFTRGTVGVESMEGTEGTATTHGLPDLTVRRAVTHGTRITSPARRVPWVISLWQEDRTADGLTGEGKLRFLCSATAIAPRELVTAAHCTREPGYLYALVGADTLQASNGTFIPVEAVRAHSGFQSQHGAGRDDIAMLRPLFPLGLGAYARLGTPALAKAVRSGTKALTIHGWGDTEAGTLSGTLRATSASPQQPTAAKIFGRAFVPSRMIAAGRLNKTTKKYAGGCSGDSGGPLTTRIDKVVYLVGVTSFGLAAACDKAPTVFVSVGDYTAWEKQTSAALVGLAKTRNTALPVALREPTATGAMGLGQALTCTPARWSSNALAASSMWLRGETPLGAGTEHVVVVEDAGKLLTCVSIAKSHAGYDGVTLAAPLIVPNLPAATGTPMISDVAFDVMPAVDSVATCGGVTPIAPDSTTTWDWLSATVHDGSDGVALQTGQSITFTAPTLDTLAGRLLVCRATTSNVMGSVSSTTYAAIPVRMAPTEPPTAS